MSPTFSASPGDELCAPGQSCSPGILLLPLCSRSSIQLVDQGWQGLPRPPHWPPVLSSFPGAPPLPGLRALGSWGSDPAPLLSLHHSLGAVIKSHCAKYCPHSDLSQTPVSGQAPPCESQTPGHLPRESVGLFNLLWPILSIHPSPSQPAPPMGTNLGVILYPFLSLEIHMQPFRRSYMQTLGSIFRL